jgi:hypothetical protein
MSPYQKTEDRNCEARECDEGVAENRLREKQVTSSLTTPIAGSTMM